MVVLDGFVFKKIRSLLKKSEKGTVMGLNVGEMVEFVLKRRGLGQKLPALWPGKLISF